MAKLEGESERGQPWRTPRLVWNIATSANSASAIVVQRLDKWNAFLWCTFQWEAASQNCTVDCAEWHFQIGLFSNTCLKEKMWLAQFQPRQKSFSFSWVCLSEALDSRRRITSVSRVVAILVKLTVLFFGGEPITFLVNRYNQRFTSTSRYLPFPPNRSQTIC